MSNPNLKEYLDVVVRLAKDAGLMMMSTSGKNTQIDEKANFRDLGSYQIRVDCINLLLFENNVVEHKMF